METISDKHAILTNHPVYQSFNDLDSIRHFMGYHVFAVWDFMSLLKSLQNHLTCVEIPWRPSIYPAEMVRLINQIVVGEESDLGPDGKATSHFDLYLKGMVEVGADIRPIKKFLETNDYSLIPDGAREFVEFNIDVAKNGHVVEVAANFFYGREKLIPDMFQTIVDTLKRENVSAPTFLYYLERHIEVDAGEHGPLAAKALTHLTKGLPELELMALNSGHQALAMRMSLWDKVQLSLHQTQATKNWQDLSSQQNLLPVLIQG
jgi:hypothetical protein